MHIQFFISFYYIRGKNVTLKLMWDHMPLTGRVYMENDGNSMFTLPIEYYNGDDLPPMKSSTTKSSTKSSKTKSSKKK